MGVETDPAAALLHLPHKPHVTQGCTTCARALLQTGNKFTGESEIAELQLPQQAGAELEAVQEPP